MREAEPPGPTPVLRSRGDARRRARIGADPLRRIGRSDQRRPSSRIPLLTSNLIYDKIMLQGSPEVHRTFENEGVDCRRRGEQAAGVTPGTAGQVGDAAAGFGDQQVTA